MVGLPRADSLRDAVLDEQFVVVVGGIIAIDDVLREPPVRLGVGRRHRRYREPHRVLVVDYRDVPGDVVRPRIALPRSGSHDVVVVRERPVADADVIRRAERGLPYPRTRLFVRELGECGGDLVAEPAHPPPTRARS